MNLEELKSKPIVQLTCEEFLFVQENNRPVEKSQKDPENKNTSKKYVYGIMGLAKLMDASRSKAQRTKNSGIINEAIIQNGRKIIIDSDKALKLLKEAEETQNNL